MLGKLFAFHLKKILNGTNSIIRDQIKKVFFFIINWSNYIIDWPLKAPGPGESKNHISDKNCISSTLIFDTLDVKIEITKNQTKKPSNMLQ